MLKLWLVEIPDHDYDENRSLVVFAETAADAEHLALIHPQTGATVRFETREIDLGKTPHVVHTDFHSG